MKNLELKQFMEQKGWSQKQVAQHFGKSNVTISQYLNGKYPTDTSELDAKTDELIALYKQKTSEAKYSAEFVMTLAASRGMEIMKYAHADGLRWIRAVRRKCYLKRLVMRWEQIAVGLTMSC